jgi:hypothetical protein
VCFLVDRDHDRKSSAVGRAERPNGETDVDGCSADAVRHRDSWSQPNT